MNLSPSFENVGRDRPRRTISREEVYGAAAAFLLVHRRCEEAVHVNWADGLLTCWCERCGDTRTYKVAGDPPAV